MIRNYEIEKKDVLGEHSKYFETDFGSNLREDQLTKLQNNLSSSDGHSAPTAHFSEIAELRAKIRRLEKIEKEVWGERRLGITRENFEEMKNEIRSLKSCLTDAHTQLTVIKSDFTHLKQKYEDKCFELEKYVSNFFGYNPCEEMKRGKEVENGGKKISRENTFFI